ncbi:uncharacterized protein LOC125952790 isoform X1 [Anopheles darlingi]|uniref:uncharacterized protein LOC125952790 isoform X1 n=1 Tax=Anopheles darlingi TaxID=43151 RepID=UPI0021004A99|nr:uncharacterized protein LOC125952790 isoform X1 [Anopheles darlingi]
MDQLKFLEYCDFFKPILVEEILLVEHPSLLPNGKCSAIGKMAHGEDKLLSLMIPELPGNYRGKRPQGGDHVEVCGTLMLYDTECSADINSTTSSGFLRERLMEADNIDELFKEMRLKYKPFIEVEYINPVKEARRMIACNLRMRCLQTNNPG